MSQPWVPDPDQLEAVEFGVTHPHAGIIMDPGFGKTSVTLAILKTCIDAGDIHRVVVCAPLLVCKTSWPNEAEKWDDFADLNVYDITEWDEANRVRILKDRTIQIVCINPESLHKVIQHKDFDKWGFDALVLDESHLFKDSQTKRFKALKPLLHKFKRRYILTGTMLPNGLQDLFGQIYCLDEGARLGSFITHFRQRYMFQIPGKPYEYFPHPAAYKQVNDLIRDIVIRKRWAERPGELPELRKNLIEVEIPQQCMPEYQRMERDYMTQVETGTVIAGNAAVAGIKLRQLANGFIYEDVPDVEASLAKGKPVFNRVTHFVHDAKIEALKTLVQSMQGRPLLVAYEFDEDKQRIKAAFPGIVDFGDCPNVAAAIYDFNAGSIPLAMGHPASVSLGLNLQEGCNTICFYNPIWNLAHYIQYIARVWRRGSKFPYVMVHHIIAKKTRDVRVGEALKAKEIAQSDFDAALVSKL